jgi:hypothetical protein
MALFSFITDSLFGKAPAAPAAPDYTGAAVAQGAANKETAVAQARLNNPNVYSPYGNQTVTWGSPDSTGVSQPTINQTLTPEAQRALTAQQNLQANLATLGGQSYGTAFDVMSRPFNYQGQVQTSLGNFNPLQSMPTAGQYGQAQGGVNAPNLQSSIDLSGVAKMPVNAGTTGQEAIMSRLEPSLARNRVSTETQLVNQGLRPGTEAYDNAIRLLGQQENDQRTQAVLQGIGLDTSANAQGYEQALNTGQFGNQTQLAGFNAGLQNQQAGNQAIAQNFGQGLTSAQAQNAQVAQQFNQAQQAAQFGNTAQQQALAQAITQRQLPLNEINALMSGSQIQNPTFSPYSGSNIAPPPIANATAQQGAFDQNTYNQQTGTYNQNLAGLYSLAGAGAYGAAKSDRRLKSNINRIGTHKLGIGIYEYDIEGRHEIGVMAQEVEQVMPEAVIHHPDGYMMVQYGRINA